MTEKWDEIQGKWNLVWVSEELELSEFELSMEVLLYFYIIK